MSTVCVNIKNFNLTLKMEETEGTIPLPPPLPPKVNGSTKQGIVSILGSDSEKNKAATAASIRRTLSADMSSKKWLSSNGFSPMKRIASSEELVNLGSSIQKEPTSVDVWSSIISQKKEENSTLPPPYIHPLVKKTSSSLTEKSLEICTESLGSETGSEIGFPNSYPPSETEEIDGEKIDHQEVLCQSFEEVEIPVVKYNKKSSVSFPPKSFPPPIPSLARDDTSSVQMQSHRENGRLILEAVSIPPQNLFRAQRLDGRLLLSLIDTSEEQETEETGDHHQETELDKVFDEIQETDYDDDEEEDDEEGDGDGDEEEEVEDQENGTKGMQIVLEKNPRLSNGGTLMMKKIMGLEKKKNNITWSTNNFNKTIVPQSLPMASFNAYEYFWRKSPTTIVNNYDDNNKVVPTPNSTTLDANGTTLNAEGTTKVASYEQQDLVVMRGNKGNINYLMPLLKGCKEPRRSLLFWEPYCIAT